MRKKQSKPEIAVPARKSSERVRVVSSEPEIEITRTVSSRPNMKIDKKDAEYTKWAKDVIATGEKLMHGRDRRKLTIDPEDYVGKPLLFDTSKTTEDEVFDWLISNMSTDNDIYYIEYEEGSKVRKDRQ